MIIINQGPYTDQSHIHSLAQPRVRHHEYASLIDTNCGFAQDLARTYIIVKLPGTQSQSTNKQT